jgi:hypothetical protein
VDPVPDPLLLRKSGRAGNRTRDLWMCSQKLLTTRPQRQFLNIRLKFFFSGVSIVCLKHFEGESSLDMDVDRSSSCQRHYIIISVNDRNSNQYTRTTNLVTHTGLIFPP